MRVPAAVVALVTVALPAARSLATPPTTLPGLSSQSESHCSARRLWGAPRRSQAYPTAVWCKEEPINRGGSDATAAASGRSSWGGGLSSWVHVARVSFFGRSAPHAASPAGAVACWNGSSSGCGEASGGGGGGGGKNGTDGVVPAGGAMDEGDDSVGAPNLSTGGTSRDDPCSAAEFGVGAPKTNAAALEPWVWLSAVWGLYAMWLRRSPLVTKAVTSGVLALGGDLAAQFFEFQQQAGSRRKGPFLKLLGGCLPIKDARRLVAVAIDSMLITGPALHCLYGLLERLMPTAAGGFGPAASHVLIDTFIFDPMFVASFFCVTGMLENRSLKQDVLPALRREFWPAVHGSWAVSFFFCPLQFLTFRYLPLEFRVLSVNVGDIAWTSVLSYFSHKPRPEAEERERNDGGGARKRVLGGNPSPKIFSAGGKGTGENPRRASTNRGRGGDGSAGGVKSRVAARA